MRSTWREVRREAARFDSGVLSGLGPAGTPVSVRCSPRLDSERRVLLIDDPFPVVPGAASILFHRHDQRLWSLRSCLISGLLIAKGEQWIFRPRRFTPGIGVGGLGSYVRLLVNGRKATNRYLAAAGLPRPRAVWEDVEELLRLAASPELR
ncbi:hypothetical protein BH18ACT6_BH18ACT6_18540 [soil metagenome]